MPGFLEKIYLFAINLAVLVMEEVMIVESLGYPAWNFCSGVFPGLPNRANGLKGLFALAVNCVATLIFSIIRLPKV